jgi:hypothetical protein
MTASWGKAGFRGIPTFLFPMWFKQLQTSHQRFDVSRLKKMAYQNGGMDGTRTRDFRGLPWAAGAKAPV